MQNIAEIAKEVFVIVSCLTLLVGLIYWVLKVKIKEDVLKDYCLKIDCNKKHETLDKAIVNSQTLLKDELRDIKNTVNEMRKMLFDFISKK